MLLDQYPHKFANVVPLTSRPPKTGEQEGREYCFETKGEIEKKIRDGKMV
jgi:guanylate kinase